jgi:hypothetical protein
MSARRTDPTTSHMAADDMAPKLAGLQAALLAAFKAAGEYGLTSDEAEAAAHLHAGARRRVSELHAAGLITPTGGTRLGRAGKAQRVFIAVVSSIPDSLFTTPTERKYRS